MSASKEERQAAIFCCSLGLLGYVMFKLSKVEKLIAGIEEDPDRLYINLSIF